MTIRGCRAVESKCLVPRAGPAHPLTLRQSTLPSPLVGRRNPVTQLVLLGETAAKLRCRC